MTANDYTKMYVADFLSKNSDFLSGTYDFGQVYGNMVVPRLIGTVIPGGSVISTGVMGASAGGNAKQEALQKGYDESQATKYGLSIGVAEAASEYFLGKITGVGENKLAKMLKKSGKVGEVLGYGYDLFGEGIQEYTQEFIDAYIEKAVLGEDIDWSEVNDQAAESFKTGVLMGGISNISGPVTTVINNGGITVESINNNNTTELLNEMKSSNKVNNVTQKNSSVKQNPVSESKNTKNKKESVFFNLGNLDTKTRAKNKTENKSSYENVHFFKNKFEKINLPSYTQFGCEIEAQNCNFKAVEVAISNNPMLKGWKVTIDESVPDHGIEVVSPPLSEKNNNNIYKQFETVLQIMKDNPADKTRSVYVDEHCGGHIHFDATMMKNNPEMIESYLRLWKEAEPLIYKMCNEEGDVLRKGAVKLNPVDGLRRMFFSVYSELYKAEDIASKNESSFVKQIPNAVSTGVKKSINGLLETANSILNPNGFAHPIGKNLAEAGKNGDYIKKVNVGKNGTTFKFDKNLKVLTKHETGLNLQHLTSRSTIAKMEDIIKGRSPINTYELRLHNSSLDLETWKANIYFDAALSKIAYEMAYEPGKNDHKLSEFFNKDLTEEQKIEKFLDLLFDDEDIKSVYRNRWSTVKDNEMYNKIKGFDENCFSKSDIEQISTKNNKKEVVEYMKSVFEKARSFMKDEQSTGDPKNLVMDYGGKNDDENV